MAVSVCKLIQKVVAETVKPVDLYSSMYTILISDMPHVNKGHTILHAFHTLDPQVE